MNGYCKLSASILGSTIWQEPSPTRIVWITMLALKDYRGIVEASIPGLADFAHVTLLECEAALKTLSEPDVYSRTKDNEGRRIAVIDGGWRVLNHAKYRDLLSADERREYQRTWDATHRADRPNSKYRKKITPDLPPTVPRQPPITPVTAPTVPTHAEADADAEAKERQPLRNGFAGGNAVFDAWNALGTVPQCLLISDTRKHKLSTRLKDPFFTANWQAALAKIKTSDFCRGGGEKGWKATFDWFIQPDSVAKTMEGKYDDRSKTHQRNTPENTRNTGTCKPVTNYATAITAKIARDNRRREAEERGHLAGEVAENAASPSATPQNGA